MEVEPDGLYSRTRIHCGMVDPRSPLVHVQPRLTLVILPSLSPSPYTSVMAFTKTQIGIAVGAGTLLVLVFVGYLWWLSNQGPVLARSEDHDPLTGLPVSIKMNPLRDRTTEKAANAFLRELRDGHCDDLLNKWEHDYHKKYAKYICSSEAQHPLLSWELVDWEDVPPLIILHYRGTRQRSGGQNDQELFTITTEHQGSQWLVTKYDAMY